MKLGLFESQRYMRDRLRSALRRGIVGVIDIGSSKIACMILKVDQERLDARRAEGVGHLGGLDALRVIGFSATQSRGVSAGDVIAMDDAERGIRTVLARAQKLAGVRVDQVIVSTAGASPRSYGVTGDTEVENGEVSTQDIAMAMVSSDMPRFGEGRDVIHAHPVNFTLDHRTGLSDPRGQVGVRIWVDMHMLSARHAAIRNISHAIRRCDLEVAGIAVSPYVSGLSALVEDEMELGAACVDLGGGTTSVSVFMRRHMIYADTIRMGGAHVTQDIAQGFAAPLEDAERVKTLHGGIQATGQDDREQIELPRIGADRELDRRLITRTELIGVIRPRMEEILEHVRESLDAAGFEHLPSQRIVLTGGGAQLPGLEDLANGILGDQVRIGRPLRIQGLPQAATGAQFSALVGLATYAAKPQDECWDFDLPARNGSQRVRRAMRWFRNNW